MRLTLIIEELFTNTVQHGYRAECDERISIALSLDGGSVSVLYEDSAPRYDPLSGPPGPPPGITRPLDSRSIGGLGVYLISQLVERPSYVYEDGYNRLHLRMQFAIDAGRMRTGAVAPLQHRAAALAATSWRVFRPSRARRGCAVGPIAATRSCQRLLLGDVAGRDAILGACLLLLGLGRRSVLGLLFFGGRLGLSSRAAQTAAWRPRCRSRRRSVPPQAVHARWSSTCPPFPDPFDCHAGFDRATGVAVGAASTCTKC
jgi:anti-sigma regulatory factor (Ser/Thr protein kinase)